MAIQKRPKKIFLFLLFSIMLILFSSVSLAQEIYNTGGVTIENEYVQDGTGVWTGRSAAPYDRTYNNIHSYFPVVNDVDEDGINEIIILADEELVILNYTTGVGLVQEVTISHGTTNISTQEYTVTPALFDVESDGVIDIISFNTTHMLRYEWNGTSIELNQSAATGLNTTAIASPVFRFPVIKCTQSTTVSNNVDTCVMPISNRSGASSIPTFLVWDLENNIVRAATSAATQDDVSFKNTHLIDGDGDGDIELYAAIHTQGLDDLQIYKVEISATPTATLLFTHNLNGAVEFTDIIVNNLNGDGGDMEITWGFTSDGTNYDAYTINADTGGLIDASYCTVLSCPEGDRLSGNLIEASDTTYCPYIGDVYYYLRNFGNNDPGVGIDTVHCISRFAGAGTQETTVANTIYNNSAGRVIHEAALHGSTGILNELFTVEDSTLQTLPLFSGETVTIPVDYQRSGSLDIIGIGGNTITYYDDAYQNQNYEVFGVAWDTANPVCLNELPQYTVSIRDNETDPGHCYYTESHANGTVLYTSPNSTVTESQFTGTTTEEPFNYLADATGTYVLTFYCRDQYHDAYDTRTYSVNVQNSSSCFYKGQGAGSEEELAAEQQAAEEFQDNVDNAFSDIGIESTSGKAMFWLILMIALAFLIFSAYNGEGIVYIIAFLEVIMLVLGWTLGMVGTVVLVIVGLVAALLLTFLWLRQTPGGG